MAHGEVNRNCHKAALGITGSEDSSSHFPNATSKGYTYVVNTCGSIADGTGSNFETTLESVTRNEKWDFGPDLKLLEVNKYDEKGMAFSFLWTQQSKLDWAMFSDRLSAKMLKELESNNLL